MDKRQLEERVIELEIEQQVTKRVRAKCIAFWSVVMTVAGLVGSWINSHIPPVKAAAQAFWEHLDK